MKIEPKTVNKSADQPQGMDINVVFAENDMEQRLLCHLLTGFLHDAQRRKRIDMDLPDDFIVDYQNEGLFVVSSGSNTGALARGAMQLYQLPRPIAVVLIYNAGTRFELAYRKLDAAAGAGAAAAASPNAAAPTRTASSDDVDQPTEGAASTAAAPGTQADEQAEQQEEATGD